MTLATHAAAQLAVIIPAYKNTHLAQTLVSLAAQTDNRFRVYVSDDASPHDLRSIVEPFRSRLDLVYQRFSDNRGQQSLISHWDRSIALSHEPWILLFSDDDLLSPDAIEGFNRDLEAGLDQNALQVWNIARIDERGDLIGVVNLPEHESWQQYLQRLFRDPDFFCVMQNVCFSRANYLASGGFDDFPSGFWTDHACWPRFAIRGGFRRITTGWVHYRQHDASLGGALMMGCADRREMLRSMGAMLRATRDLIARHGGCPGCDEWTQLQWFGQQLRYVRRPLDRKELLASEILLAQLWPRWPLVRECVYANHALRPWIRHWQIIQYMLARRRPSRRTLSRAKPPGQPAPLAPPIDGPS